MNIKHNKLITLILAVLLLVTVATLVTSCGGGGSKVSEIYVTKADLPRVDYVEGQELDLSKGRLTVVTGDGETKISLTDPAVTVTGYDKDVIGSQSLTVTYMELTTSFNVNVVKRAVAEGYETKYFVGGNFDQQKGKIKITTDDATSFYVNMNDKAVSLVSFDSSVAGASTVTVLYNDGVNSCYCQFDVMVYEQSNIVFTPPVKNEYLSHYDGAPNVTGGYFKVTSSDSSLTMNVPLTADMVEGFDPSAATLANKSEPLKQTLTVNYLGKTFSYEIYVTFSSVSAVNYYAGSELLAGIDWADAKENGLTDKQSAAAIAAVTEYYSLAEKDLELISDEAKAIIGRAGTLAIADAFYEELSTYSDSFKLSTDGNIYFMKSSYEKTAADVKRLNDPNEAINVYAPLLRKLLAEFGELPITEELFVKNFVIVYSEQMESAFKAILNHLVDVYTLVKDIPAEWDRESLKPFGDNLVSAVMQMYSAGYYKNGNTTYYTSILSPWREKNDLFDIIHTYFLYDYEGGAEFMSSYMWGSMPMPGKLQEWYTGLAACLNASLGFKNYATAGTYLIDVSSYMYNYFRTLEICEEIKSSENQFWIDIYNVYNGDNINRTYMQNYSYGYLYHVGAMIDSEAFHELWLRYYDVLKLYVADDLSSETHKEQITAMFEAFEALTPTELLGFLSSLNFMYTSGGGKLPMLGHTVSEDTEEQMIVYNLFSYVLSNNFASYLTETNQVLFNDLLSAMESFVLIGYKDGARDDFNTKMAALAEKVKLLSDEDAANMDEYFGTAYANYLSLYELTSGNTTADLTADEEKLIAEYVDTLEKYFIVYGTVYNLIQNGYTVAEDVYPIIYALYARASDLRSSLIEIGSEAALKSMYTFEHDIHSVKYTLEQAYYAADSITTSLLTNMDAIVTLEGKVSYVTYWDLYSDNGIAKLLSDNAHILYAAYFEDEGAVIEYASLLALMSEMRTYDTFKMSVVALLNIDDTFYRTLSNYYKTVLTEDGQALGKKVITAAETYTVYSISKTDDNLAAFTAAMEGLAAEYEKLNESDREALADLYNYYAVLLEELTDASNGAEAA